MVLTLVFGALENQTGNRIDLFCPLAPSSKWMELMQPEDLRALTPLIWGHVNPYGTFQLDLIDTAA